MSEHVTEMDPRTARAEKMQKLREGPKTGAELGSRLSATQRVYVRQIRLPSTSRNDVCVEMEKPRVVYYLWGDERRAVRRLIDIHPNVFESVFGGDGLVGRINLLASEWQPEMVQLAREEWDMRESRRVAADGGESA